MNEARIITKEYAKANGRKFYFTGLPCKKAGHISERYTRSSYCRECEILRNKERKLGIKKEAAPKPDGFISLPDAREKGLRYYFTGQPCNRGGHMCLRYVSSSVCVECAKDYIEERRAANEVKQNEARYWKKEPKIPGARLIKGRCQSGSL
jgi:hypothetical protein